MPTTRSNLAQTPVNSDTLNWTGDLATLADSLEVIVPAANTAAGDTIATARAAAGFAVSDARPLFIWDQSQDCIMVKDSSGWRGAGARQRHMEFYENSFAVSGGYVSWDAGALEVDAAKTINGGFATQSGTSGTITIQETGWYSVLCNASPQASAGNAAVFLRKNGVVISAASTSGFPQWEACPVIPRLQFTSGDNLLVVVIAQTAQNWTTRVYLDKLDN
jgi:hypothetical protein